MNTVDPAPHHRVTEAFTPKQLRIWVPQRRRTGERRRCSFDLPVGLADAFRSVCTLQGFPMRDVAQSLFEAYVEQHKELLPA